MIHQSFYCVECEHVENVNSEIEIDTFEAECSQCGGIKVFRSYDKYSPHKVKK